ncbi:MAG: MazG nucleotide pyrophosphohydrolase domain-containing protein [Promethearchaeota archaeon]
MEINEFQRLMKTLYGKRDKKRGPYLTTLWLMSELGELAEAVRIGKGIEEELADVFAWLASLANILEIDLEQAALTKYQSMCPRCKSAPCECIFED